MHRHPEISAFILGGGASTRMGTEKGLLQFRGEPLVVRTTKLLEPLVSEVVVVGRPETYVGLGLRVIPDRFINSNSDPVPMRTPLVGMASALCVTNSSWNLILACDLPYLTREWLDWLLNRAVESGAQAMVPRTSRGSEPLAAVYRQECASAILAQLERGIRRVTEGISSLLVEYADEIEWSALDPERHVLRNMNTPEEYEAAKAWFERANRGA
jgi:molybdenum cofactor guanylyltransferase